MTDVIKKATELIKPSEKEIVILYGTIDQIKSAVTNQLKLQGINADLIVGGSVAKNTWLPGIHDIDFFLRFNYNKYKGKSDQLADIAEKVLKNCFPNIQRLHGSRDYFKFNYGRTFEIEVIPVLKISDPKKMLNITDVSPLHVDWVKKYTDKDPGMATQIRLSKKFFKAAGVYGAESYIQGFSGHVIEVLTIFYGGFVELLVHTFEWQRDNIIDSNLYYHKRKQNPMDHMNSSKLVSPLVVVDPVQPERNAVAALSKEKMSLLIKASRRFMKKMSLSHFKEKEITISQLKARSKKKKLVLFTLPAENNKIDIAGAKMLKKFNYLLRVIEDLDFKILNKGWQWDKKINALLWIYLDKKILSQTKRHWGPATNADSRFVNAFKRRNKKYGIKQIRGRLFVDIPRKYRKIEDLLKDIKKDKRLDKLRVLEVI